MQNHAFFSSGYNHQGRLLLQELVSFSGLSLSTFWDSVLFGAKNCSWNNSPLNMCPVVHITPCDKAGDWRVLLPHIHALFCNSSDPESALCSVWSWFCPCRLFFTCRLRRRCCLKHWQPGRLWLLESGSSCPINFQRWHFQQPHYPHTAHQNATPTHLNAKNRPSESNDILMVTPVSLPGLLLPHQKM